MPIFACLKKLYHWIYDFYINLKVDFCIFVRLRKVEYYQPLYYKPLTRKKPQRLCVDRAEAIAFSLKEYGHGLRIVDFGSSLGYFEFYFAERGYLTTGYDSTKNNILIAKILQLLSPQRGNIQFKMETLDKKLTSSLSYRKYDVGFLFSILHHICHNQGLEVTQDILADLTQKIPILFIEFAIKGEGNFYWNSTLPEKIEDYFLKCHNVEIELIGYFPTHLSYTLRPLYKVTRKNITINKKTYPLSTQFYSAHAFTDSYGRGYYVSQQLFIKEYLLKDTWLKNAFAQETKILEALKSTPNVPKLIESTVHNTLGYIFMEYIQGDLLHKLILQNRSLDRIKVIKDLLKIVQAITEQGIYHNDLRLWNIILDQNKLSLIDFSHADNEEKESNKTALLMIIYQLYNPYPFIDIQYPIQADYNFQALSYPSEIQEIVDRLTKVETLTAFFKTTQLHHQASQI